MTETELLRLLRQIAARAEISYCDLATAAGVSPATARAALELGRLPRRASACRQLAAFARANETAAKREEIHFARLGG